MVRPARHSRISETDGTRVPFCANHIPDEEAREKYDEKREKGWNAPLAKPVN